MPFYNWTAMPTAELLRKYYWHSDDLTDTMEQELKRMAILHSLREALTSRGVNPDAAK